MKNQGHNRTSLCKGGLDVSSIMRCILMMLVGLAVVLYPAGGVQAGVDAKREHEVKAAFMYSFAKYVQWPESSLTSQDGPMLLGILGENPFGEILESIKGKTIHGKTLSIKKISSLQEGKACHVLYINESESDNLPQIFEALQGHPVLTVSDMDRFIAKGGMIHLFIKANKVRFAVNPEAASKADLQISSRLLKLAIIK